MEPDFSILTPKIFDEFLKKNFGIFFSKIRQQFLGSKSKNPATLVFAKFSYFSRKKKILKNFEKWRRNRIVCDRTFEKKCLTFWGIPRNCENFRKLCFQHFEENNKTIILRPKWGNLSEKRRRGEFCKLNNAKNENRLVPPPLRGGRLFKGFVISLYSWFISN